MKEKNEYQIKKCKEIDQRIEKVEKEKYSLQEEAMAKETLLMQKLNDRNIEFKGLNEKYRK